MRMSETAVPPLDANVRIVEACGRERLNGAIAKVVPPYSGSPAGHEPMIGVCGHHFGSNLYRGDVIELL